MPAPPEVGLEWEPIPDDVLVPRRDRRDRFARPFPRTSRWCAGETSGSMPSMPIVGGTEGSGQTAKAGRRSTTSTTIPRTPTRSSPRTCRPDGAFGEKATATADRSCPRRRSPRRPGRPDAGERGRGNDIRAARRATRVRHRAAGRTEPRVRTLRRRVFIARIRGVVREALRRRAPPTRLVRGRGGRSTQPAAGAFRREVASARRDGTLRAPTSGWFEIATRSSRRRMRWRRMSFIRWLTPAKVALEEGGRGAGDGEDVRKAATRIAATEAGRPFRGGHRGDGRFQRISSDAASRRDGTKIGRNPRRPRRR